MTTLTLTHARTSDLQPGDRFLWFGSPVEVIGKIDRRTWDVRDIDGTRNLMNIHPNTVRVILRKGRA